MCGLRARVSLREREVLEVRRRHEVGGEGVTSREVVAGGGMSPMRGLWGTWAEGTGKWEEGVQARAPPGTSGP